MKVSSAIKKLAKVAKVQDNIVNGQIRGHFAEMKDSDGDDYIIGFSANGVYSPDADIVCIYTRAADDHSDSMTDYFAECFHRNLTQAINFLSR